MDKKELLRNIPKVDELLRSDAFAVLSCGAVAVREAVRGELEELRAHILAGEVTELPDEKTLCGAIARRAQNDTLPSLRPVINGTGVVLHTNLGRACLSERAVNAAAEVARGYSTLEYDLATGQRGSRHDHVEELLCRITGAEAAMVVNNNAAAVLLILSDIAKGGEVITSRGELVEIGGSFRIPDIMSACGCRLREVGTTNKTHLRDYEEAVCEETRALLKVHTSNFRIVGFTESVSLEELVALGKEKNLPVIQDIGSGSLVELGQFGIHDEPTVQASVRAGVDVISFSGDKLLGGPQAGIIIGKKKYIDSLKRHPLARAMRVDKVTFAALRETLWAYTDPALAVREIPTLAMLAATPDELRAKAALLRDMLEKRGVAAEVVETTDQVGGGSVPTQMLPTYACAIVPEKLSVDALEEKLRLREKPIIGRISKEQYLLDARTLMERDFEYLADSVAEVHA